MEHIENRHTFLRVAKGGGGVPITHHVEFLN